MKITPNLVIADLEEYLRLFHISLSKQARRTLLDIEEFAYRCDHCVNVNLFFSKIIRNYDTVRNILMDRGINPNLAALILEKSYYDTIEDTIKYREVNFSYSQMYMRRDNPKTDIIDRALEYCVLENRDILENKDLLLASMDYFEESIAQDHGYRKDKTLDESPVTLSHVYGRYNENLWIEFDEIRKRLQNSKALEENIELDRNDINIFLHYDHNSLHNSSTHTA
ncbi:MAG: hypothetical protein PWP07_749 [Epulopiscium sp.]|uniref:Uncharacterized protein n=1 Tax=Defluviitalea raffinosedens TaxID=1450156 RepID=A0A7C8HDY0_9FIRM|nr:hypothetical protein [Defluviitalea raffinosedens]KAE9633179.1 hypothetical protein GND95_09900 [Defluviitalea raffinosedens]MBM7686162.1 hypothetical protein [Defluviitalea raffinosedens]MDK2787524.1 hypothetical protein [Candidatus Epulonipiscium sp.]